MSTPKKMSKTEYPQGDGFEEEEKHNPDSWTCVKCLLVGCFAIVIVYSFLAVVIATALRKTGMCERQFYF